MSFTLRFVFSLFAIWYFSGSKSRKITLSFICTQEFSKTQHVILISVWLYWSFPTFYPHHLSYARRPICRHGHKILSKYSMLCGWSMLGFSCLKMYDVIIHNAISLQCNFLERNLKSNLLLLLYYVGLTALWPWHLLRFI